MNPLGEGCGSEPGDQKLAFVPMDAENLPVSTCVCAGSPQICKEVARASVPQCTWRAVCVRVYLGHVRVHRRARERGAEAGCRCLCLCWSGPVALGVEAGGVGVQGSAAARAVCVCERTCVRGCWSRREGADAQAVDRWAEGCVGCVGQMNLGHSVPSPGAVGHFGPEGLAQCTFSGAEQGQPPLSLTPSSPDLVIPVLFSPFRSSTTTWMPARPV